MHGFQTAICFEPAGDEAEHVDGEGGYGIEKRVVVDEGLVAEDLWNGIGATGGEFVFDDNEGDAGGSEVFLCAGIDEAEIFNIEGSRENIR